MLILPPASLRPGLTQIEAAALLGVSRRTLNNWRRAGFGPQPVSESGRPHARLLYDRAAVESFAAGAVA